MSGDGEGNFSCGDIAVEDEESVVFSERHEGLESAPEALGSWWPSFETVEVSDRGSLAARTRADVGFRAARRALPPCRWEDRIWYLAQPSGSC